MSNRKSLTNLSNRLIWIRDYCKEGGKHYYYNRQTGEKIWVSDVEDDADDPSSEHSPAATAELKPSSSKKVLKTSKTLAQCRLNTFRKELMKNVLEKDSDSSCSSNTNLKTKKVSTPLIKVPVTQSKSLGFGGHNTNKDGDKTLRGKVTKKYFNKDKKVIKYLTSSVQSLICNTMDALSSSAHLIRTSKNEKDKKCPSADSLSTIGSTESDNDFSMDWEDVEDQSDSSNESKSSTSILKNFHIINSNLLRIGLIKCGEPSGDSSDKYLKEHIYFVLDTNILIHNISFIDSIYNMQFLSTKGSVVYIPYIVLQELDKLKLNTSNELKYKARQAIRYLNKHLNNGSNLFQAQSALDERDHMIDVQVADDSIINCCLQLKPNVSYLLLLTNDINFRNKAISNDIYVSCKADLLKEDLSTT